MASKQLIKKSAGAGQDGIKDPLIDAEEGLTESFGDEPAPKPSRYTRKFWIVSAIVAAVACAAVVAVGGAAFYLLRPPPPRSAFDAEHLDHAPPRKMVALINKPPVDDEQLPELSVIDTVSSNAESMDASAPSSDAESKVAVALFEELPNAGDVAAVPTTVAAAVIDNGATASTSDGSRLESQGTAAASSAAGEALLWDDYFFGGDDEYRSYEAEGDDDDDDDELYQDGDDNYFDDNDYQMGSFDPFDGDDDDYFDLYQDDTVVEVDQSSSPTELDDGSDDNADSFDKPVVYDYSVDDDEALDESNDRLEVKDGDNEWIFGDLDGYDYSTSGQEEGVKEEEKEEEEQQSWSDSSVANDDYSDSTFDDTAVYYRGDDSYEDDAGADVADVSDLFDVVYDQEEPSYGGGEDGRREEEEAIAVPYAYYDDAVADTAEYEQQSQSEADDLF